MRHSGTCAAKIPGTDRYGYGNIHHFSKDWKHVEELEVENAEELTGFKGVTHTTLHPSEEYLTYTSETGKRVMRYDLMNKCQSLRNT